MVMKGCTAAYDLAHEYPLPSVEGLSAMARAYEDVGMRAVLAPMVADLTFFEAIPGLMDRLPPALQKEAETFRYAPWKATTKQMKKALQKWPFEMVHLALAPTIPHHCSDAFLVCPGQGPIPCCSCPPHEAHRLRRTRRQGGVPAWREGHHPRLTTEWGKVAVTWWTHKIRNLHKNDFIMAAKTDGIYRKYAQP